MVKFASMRLPPLSVIVRTVVRWSTIMGGIGALALSLAFAVRAYLDKPVSASGTLAVWLYSCMAVFVLAGLIELGLLSHELAALKGSTRRALGETRDGLVVGPYSTLGPIPQCNEARTQFKDCVKKADAGDYHALAQLQVKGQALLDVSRKTYASGLQYAKDFELVERELKRLSKTSE